jgi:cell division protein ZapA
LRRGFPCIAIRVGNRVEAIEDQPMSQISVTINGRQFRMACEDGQEGHLMNLARDLDERIEELRKKHGEIGDTRLTVMAALTVADSLAETGARIKRLEDELAGLKSTRGESVDRSKATRDAIAAALNAAAERVEGITKKLNQTASSGSSVASD